MAAEIRLRTEAVTGNFGCEPYQEPAMALDPLVFNGIDGSTGDYLLPPQPAEVISAIARNESVAPRHLEELRRWWWRISQTHLAPIEGVDPKDLAQAGWGVIFAHDA